MQVDERIDRCPRRGYPARDITDAPETSLGIEVSATLTMSRLDDASHNRIDFARRAAFAKEVVRCKV